MLIHLQSPRSPATTNPSDPERRVPLKKTQTEGYTSNTRKTRDLPPASSCSLAAEPRTLLYPPVRARLEALIFPEISQDNRVICHRTTSIYNTTADRGTQRVQVCWSQMAQPIKMVSILSPLTSANIFAVYFKSDTPNNIPGKRETAMLAVKLDRHPPFEIVLSSITP